MAVKAIYKRSIVTVERLGELHIREPSASATIKLVHLGKRQAKGEPVEEDLIRLVLRAGVINPDGTPMFKSDEDPLEVWPIMEASKVAEHVQKFLIDAGETLGNSGASPSAA